MTTVTVEVAQKFGTERERGVKVEVWAGVIVYGVGVAFCDLILCSAANSVVTCGNTFFGFLQ